MKKMARKKRTTLTLEDYENFLDHPYENALSVCQINQIIFMHGFNKIQKRPKQELYDALSTIDLIRPQRLTLKEIFRPYETPLLSLDQVKQDLEALKWQECHVQSMETIGASLENCRLESSGGEVVAEAPAEVVSSFSITRKRRRSKSKRIKTESTAKLVDVAGTDHAMTASVDEDGSCDAAYGGAGGPQSDSPLFVDTYRWDF